MMNGKSIVVNGGKNMNKFFKYFKEEFFNEPMWETELRKIEQCNQRQDSLKSQMVDLIEIANKFGFYDAADYIEKEFMN
jgi:hypothetical protein